MGLEVKNEASTDETIEKIAKVLLVYGNVVIGRKEIILIDFIGINVVELGKKNDKKEKMLNIKANYKNKKVSIIDIIKLYLYIGKLRITKKKRNQDVINNEFNLGLWNRKYETIDFESVLGEYGKNPDSLTIIRMNNRLFKGYYRDYVEKYHQQFLDVLDNYIDQPIVELGCGLGINLFQLNHRNFTKVEGFDISENAISLAKRHNTENNCGIHFGILDLKNSLPNGIIKDKVVFTHACIEQLKYSMPTVLKNIIDGKPKIVINFEEDYDSSPYMIKKYFDACDYQNNLVRELRKLEKEKKIEIISIKKLPLNLSPVHNFSVITWKTTL